MDHVAEPGKYVESLQAENASLKLQNDEARKALEIISEFDAKDFAQFGAQALMDAAAVAKVGLSKMKLTEKQNCEHNEGSKIESPPGSGTWEYYCSKCGEYRRSGA